MITAEQREEITKRLEQGETDSAKIATEVGVSKMQVAAVKAWRKMRRDARDAPDGAPEAIVDAIEATFGLERDLQHALRDNIEQLEHGLKVTDGGKEQKVDSGFIDITAQDHTGTTVVIELKAGTADRETIGQILGYMGDLQRHSAKPVRGIIVAGDFTVPTVSALGALPSLQLRKYGFSFSFDAIGPEKK